MQAEDLIKRLKYGAHGLFIIGLVVNLFFLTKINLALGWKLPFVPATWFESKYKIVTIIDTSCGECRGLDEVLKFFKEGGLKIGSEEVIDYATDKTKAEKFIKKYQISKLPALVVDGPRPQDSNLAQFWDNFGTITKKAFVLNRIQPPYRDLGDGLVKGQFKVTFLSDKSCAKCYDVKTHRNAFQLLSMKISQEEEFDLGSTEGKSLVDKYKIKSVPTILVDGDLAEYDGFQTVWPNVGTKEDDGVYIFRAGVPQMGIYRNLESGKIIEAAAPSTGK